MTKFNQYDEVIVNNTAPITARGLRGRVIKTDDNGAWIAYSGVARGGGWYPEGELSLVDTVDTPSQPDLAQQLADAIERAERAERQAAVLKAFVEGLAGLMNERPYAVDYFDKKTKTLNTEAYRQASARYGISENARETLKAVGDE